MRDDEDALFDSAANLQRGIETVGGWLYLTTGRLIFEAHRFNLQSGATIVPLRDLEDTWTCWTKLFGLVPVFPNSLAVTTATNKTYRFALADRGEWLRAIRKAKRAWARANDR